MAKAPAEIKSLARAHTETAIRTLVSIMNQEKSPAAARVAAAQALIDRGWGKATQIVETTIRRIANQMSDDELADIAAGSGENAADAQEGTSESRH